MKNQPEIDEVNRPSESRSLSVVAMWGLCLAGLFALIAGNFAHQAKTDAPLAAPAPAAPLQAAPLTTALRPSAFAGVSVRSVTVKPAASGHRSNKPVAAWIYRKPGAPLPTIAGRTSPGGGYGGGGNKTGGANGFVSRRGPQGSTITRFDPAYAPHERVHITRGADGRTQISSSH